MKKKIAFLAPRNKGGTYYYYEGITQFLQEHYGDEYEVYFFASYWKYFLLHFQRYDCIFSIVPFFWKPIRSKKYIFNLHGNYKEEGNIFTVLKTLKIYQLNLWFSDCIMLVSHYLADEMGFRKQYEEKIKIVPNYIRKPAEFIPKNKRQELRFLTVSSSSFYEKARGVIDLIKVIQKIGERNKNQDIIFTIVGIKDTQIRDDIQNKTSSIKLSSHIKIAWKDWLTKEELNQEFLSNDYFLYWSYLDNFPGVFLEALNYGLLSYSNNYKSFPYFLDEEFLCENHAGMCEKVLQSKKQNTQFLSEYYIEGVAGKLHDVIQKT